MNPQIATFKTMLGDCKYMHTCDCIVKSSYEFTSLSTFYIYDEQQDMQAPVRIVGEGDSYQLTVHNETRDAICLIKTDKCLFTNVHKKCDCILTGKNKYFFVEISEASDKKAKRNHAIEQLGSTIEILTNNNIDLSTYDTKAIICFKNGRSRPTQAAFNAKKAAFFEKYKISLEEDNQIVF